jgi:REP element-mobilizing transposase RayT
MSRVVNRDFIFGDSEKEFFRTTMRKLEAFTGIRVLTYCIMSNHWHILLEVPTLAVIDDETLFARLNAFYPKQRASDILREFGQAAKYAEETGKDFWLSELRIRYGSRMGDLSVFVKELKERFSKWYNRRHGRRGTLWEERFKSVLVEDSEHAISTMAAYIELNPVRAGLVEDPRDYRFCGYAEAVAGGKEARAGIEEILFMMGQEAGWRTLAAKYRVYLFSTGEMTDERSGFDPEKVRQVIEEGGELSHHELMRCRVRYFSDGVALGSKAFLEEVFAQHRSFFGERRKSGARRMRGGRWDGLCCLRDLRNAPLTAPG